MLSRRTFLAAGLGLATAAALLPPAPPTLSTRDGPDLLAELVPLILRQNVSQEHYARYFRLRARRVPELRHRYAVLAARLEAAAPPEAADRPARLAKFWSQNEANQAEFREDVWHHYAQTEAWLAIGYPSWPGRPDPERISA